MSYASAPPAGSPTPELRGRTCMAEAPKDVLRVAVVVQSLSPVRLFASPWTVARHAPLAMGFSRQEYWSGLPFPSPGDLPDPGIEPASPVRGFFTAEPPGHSYKLVLSPSGHRHRRGGRACTHVSTRMESVTDYSAARLSFLLYAMKVPDSLQTRTCFCVV